MNELLALLMEWGQAVTWQAPFWEIESWRKHRREAAEIHELDRVAARHLDKTADDCRLRGIHRGHELAQIADGLRTHAPELLGMVPMIDFFEPQPEDLKPYAAKIRDIEGRLRARVVPTGNDGGKSNPHRSGRKLTQTVVDGIANDLLKTHHQFEDRIAGYFEPISNERLVNALSEHSGKPAKKVKGNASQFWKRAFPSHGADRVGPYQRYEAACRGKRELVNYLIRAFDTGKVYTQGLIQESNDTEESIDELMERG